MLKAINMISTSGRILQIYNTVDYCYRFQYFNNEMTSLYWRDLQNKHYSWKKSFLDCYWMSWDYLLFRITWVYPWFLLGVRCSSIFSFMCVASKTFCLSFPFLFVILLSVLLWFSVSRYLFGIFHILFRTALSSFWSANKNGHFIY